MKLSVIVIPRISPSTAAARCQQDSTIHKTSLFIQRSNSIIIHLAQKSPSIPPPIPPKTVFVFFFLFLNSHIITSTHLFLRTCTYTSPYSSHLTSPHLTLTSSSPTPQKETTPPNASSKPFVSQAPIFPFRLDCSC